MTDSTINAAASPQQATQDHRHYLRPHYQPGIPAAVEAPGEITFFVIADRDIDVPHIPRTLSCGRT